MSLLSRLPRDAARLVSARNCPRYVTISAISGARLERLNKYVEISEEVRIAVSKRAPVVALESAIITHGLPSPDNVELAAQVEAVVRENGAVPATIGIVNGLARVGLSRSMIEALGSGLKSTMKVSRRDLPYITGIGLESGGTTVAGTMVLAHMAGIKIFATGGIGGVHRAAANSMDISADLMELSRTNVAVVCSGPKPFLDIERTVEYLETAGVPVMTFGSLKTEKTWLPVFYSRDSLVLSPLVVETPAEAAGIIFASHMLGLQNGQLFCNPIPHDHHISRLAMHAILTAAVKRATKREISGKDVTPFILDHIRRTTGGTSVEANKALVLSNAKQAAKMAVELAKLEFTTGNSVSVVKFKSDDNGAEGDDGVAGRAPEQTPEQAPEQAPVKLDLLVIGSIAVDISCDAAKAVALHTSNPSRITESLGGVGNNVATAAHYIGARVRLVSAVGRDLSGDWALEKIKGVGLDPSGIQVLSGKSTARYVAVNGSDGEMSVASADMLILENIDSKWWRAQIASSSPEWICIDGNLSARTIENIVLEAWNRHIKVAFEPTSQEKSTRILSPTMAVYPQSGVDLSAPNELELASIFNAAKKMGLFESKGWFQIIDAINVDSMFLNKVDMMGREAKVDFGATGIIQQAIHLSPYFPNQLIKLGANGVLSVRLITSDAEPSVESRAIVSAGTGSFRGISVNHFPAETPQKIVSVNGVGDTFLGALLGNLSQTKSWRDYELNIDAAQKAACLTLASSESVNPEIRIGKNRAIRHPGLEPRPDSWASTSQVIKPRPAGNRNW